jgi:hypothetical protein
MAAAVSEEIEGIHRAGGAMAESATGNKFAS